MRPTSAFLSCLETRARVGTAQLWHRAPAACRCSEIVGGLGRSRTPQQGSVPFIAVHLIPRRRPESEARLRPPTCVLASHGTFGPASNCVTRERADSRARTRESPAVSSGSGGGGRVLPRPRPASPGGARGTLRADRFSSPPIRARSTGIRFPLEHNRHNRQPTLGCATPQRLPACSLKPSVRQLLPCPGDTAPHPGALASGPGGIRCRGYHSVPPAEGAACNC